MAIHKITKGLDLPITGEPSQTIEEAPAPAKVALVADDYIGMKPRFLVKVGDSVKRGQRIFEDKKTPGVGFTSPGAGTLVEINRGERRALQSVVIELSEGERSGQPADSEHQRFESYADKSPLALSRDDVKGLLLESGLWTALRARPFCRVPQPETAPHSIFVTATDTNPLAASVDAALAGNEASFEAGLVCVSKLTDGTTFLCKHPDSAVKAPADAGECNIQTEEFTGVHPAGTAGVHIHLLDPVSRSKTVWYLNYQDVVAIGKLFTTGKLDVGRIVSLAGPAVKSPRLLRTRLGASTDDLVAGGLEDGENRVISGSVLSGRTASGALAYLGRYDLQVSALREGREREFMSWTMPGFKKFSTITAFFGSLFPRKKRSFTTTTNGGHRAMVPIGMYERMMPMDIEPAFLLRSLIVGDIENAEKLGCLELAEEDVALCTFVCPGKIDYGPILRKNLETIEKEG